MTVCAQMLLFVLQAATQIGSGIYTAALWASTSRTRVRSRRIKRWEFAALLWAVEVVEVAEVAEVVDEEEMRGAGCGEFALTSPPIHPYPSVPSKRLSKGDPA